MEDIWEIHMHMVVLLLFLSLSLQFGVSKFRSFFLFYFFFLYNLKQHWSADQEYMETFDQLVARVDLNKIED